MSRKAQAAIVFAAVSCAGLGLIVTDVSSKSSAPSYTVAQAKRGEEAYMINCAELCHGYDLDNGDALPLRGPAFREHWNGQGLDGPFMIMTERMPPFNPGGLPAQTYADILAFVLSKNGVEPSGTELPADTAALAEMTVPQ